jgi:putative ABC transport system substrate-binding protein
VQQRRQRRVGLLADFSDAQMQPLISAFRERLEKSGWTDENIRIDYRLAIGESAKFQAAAVALIGLAPDVVVTQGSPALRAIRQETSVIPVVFTFVADPVAQGFVETLARPGGNLTGFTNFAFSFAAKWLDALKEIVPRISRVVLIVNPGNPSGAGLSQFLEKLAPTYSVEVVPVHVRSAEEIESAITKVGDAPDQALIILPDGLPVMHRDLIIELVNRARIPAVYPFRTFARNGGLMSWGTDFPEVYRQAATYVDRILRGAKPGELPVQAPNKFELVINLKTAKALGLEVAPTLLVLADEVIE